MPDCLPLHIWALVAGFLLDLLVGDPEWFPHPVRFMGKFIAYMEKWLRKHIKNLRHAAPLLTASTVLLSMALTALILWALLCFGEIPLFIGMTVFSWMCISVKNLADEANGVARALMRGIDAGRNQVARIVGRDTAGLSEEEIVKATIETVAENTTDGVISPMIYLAVGGPILAMGFKAASTLDSMVGYMNDKYIDLGWFSAKFDDILNYIPARITGVLMCLCSTVIKLDGRNALRILLRDHKNHKSPNCAWSEAAAAGAMHIQLGGTHVYFGKPVEKPTIGDDGRKPGARDIGVANRLLYLSAVLMVVLIAGLCLLL